MSNNHVEIWEKCLSVIRDNVTEQNYKTWFAPIEPISLVNNKLTIQVPQHFFVEILEEKYIDLLKTVIKRFVGEKGKLDYKVVVDSSDSTGTVILPSSNHNYPRNVIGQPPPQRLSEGPINPFVIPGLKKLQIDSQLNENYTFDTFIEGDCNRLARSAGLKIAREPGKTAFNPLVIYSGTSLGTTHLCHAIGLETKRLHPEKTVLYVQDEQLSTQYVTANKNNNRPDFINFYQMIDVLIIDDIQFLAGKSGTQDVFFHIFNHLQQNNKQIVITSDKFPSDLQGMEDRLLSRLKWGLTADLQAPDLTTRISIINEKLYGNGISFPDDVVEYIAGSVRSNIRELEGVTNSLLAQSLLNKKAITLDMAQQIIERFVRNTVKEVSVEYIINVVCDYFKISPEQMTHNTRKRQVVQTRQIAMYVSKKYSNASLVAIGKQCGKKDHATVYHAIKTVTNQLETDKQFKVMFADIEKKIALS